MFLHVWLLMVSSFGFCNHSSGISLIFSHVNDLCLYCNSKVSHLKSKFHEDLDKIKFFLGIGIKGVEKRIGPSIANPRLSKFNFCC